MAMMDYIITDDDEDNHHMDCPLSEGHFVREKVNEDWYPGTGWECLCRSLDPDYEDERKWENPDKDAE